LIKDRWKEAGESFLTLFQDVIVYPGIRHKDTLEAVSSLSREYDRDVPSSSIASGSQGTTYTTSTNSQRQRILPPDQVYAGPVPQNQDMLIHLFSQGVGMLCATPYWRGPQWDGPPGPWPQVLASCVVNALGSPESMWAQAARAMGRTNAVEPTPICPFPT
jgi:hypothetical protein